MKVVHIESGLGNQMLSYCEYLVLKKLHPYEDIYIENIIYDISEANEVIKQWNGYELERIFGIHAPNVKSLFTIGQWNDIMREIRASEFWMKNWNYPVYFTQALNHAGLHLKNIRGDFEQAVPDNKTGEFGRKIPSVRERFSNTSIGFWVRHCYKLLTESEKTHKNATKDKIFYMGDDDVFTGQWLGLKMRDSGIEYVDKELHDAFQFPEWDNSKNKDMVDFLETVNSVVIHARRGDMLGANNYLYKYGYFRRAVKYIKRHVENPVFVFFCDPGSIDWCRQNEQIFALNFKKDKVYFVDWNKGEESFRDMQLMSHCKHAIVTNSSFGWWGSYLISNPDKITISPIEEIIVNTTHHC